MKRDWSGWDTSFQTNTSAIIAVSAAFLHLLDAGNKKRGWATGRREVQERAEGVDYDANDPRTSQIITVASIASFNRFVTAGLAYSATKAGAAMLGKALATLLAPFAIRSNVIAPGSEYLSATLISHDILTWHRIPFRHDRRRHRFIPCHSDSCKPVWLV